MDILVRIFPYVFTIIFSYLISCGHYSYHREFLNLHFCDSHSGQKTDLRWAHVGPFSQHALPALNVVADWPKVGGERMNRGKMLERLYREHQQKPQALVVYFGTSHNARKQTKIDTLHQPNVLPWTSLYKDSYFQLFCALKEKQTQTNVYYILQLTVLGRKSQTYVLRLSEQFCVFNLDNSISTTGDGSACRHPHNLSWHHCMGGLQV